MAKNSDKSSPLRNLINCLYGIYYFLLYYQQYNLIFVKINMVSMINVKKIASLFEKISYSSCLTFYH